MHINSSPKTFNIQS